GRLGTAFRRALHHQHGDRGDGARRLRDPVVRGAPFGRSQHLPRERRRLRGAPAPLRRRRFGRRARGGKRAQCLAARGPAHGWQALDDLLDCRRAVRSDLRLRHGGRSDVPGTAGAEPFRDPCARRLRALRLPVVVHHRVLPRLLECARGGRTWDRSRVSMDGTALAQLDARYPWVGWLWRWGISAWSLALGLLTLFVFRRGLPHVGWIVGYLLLLWYLFAVFAERRAVLERRGRGLVVAAGEYVILSLCHNLLLFVLPAYYASATLTSANAAFLAVLTAAAGVTAIDPAYRRLVQPSAWRRHLLFGFSMFAALNVALPLVGVRPIVALTGSGALAVLSLTPALRQGGTLSWKKAYARAVILACLA